MGIPRVTITLRSIAGSEEGKLSPGCRVLAVFRDFE